MAGEEPKDLAPKVATAEQRSVKKQPEQKRINPSAAPKRPQQPDGSDATKIKAGKANLARDIPIFLGIMGFMFLVAFMAADVGQTDDQRQEKKRNSLKELQDTLKKAAEAQRARELARKRTMDCDLFLAPSSIPEAGLGVFAGRRYEQDENVLMHLGMFYPVAGRQDDSDLVYVSQYGFLLKHHPFLSNLRGGSTWVKDDGVDGNTIENFKAARVIEPGDELFLAFHDHPHRVLGEQTGITNIPVLGDYRIAEEIVQDEIESQRRSPSSRKTGPRSTGPRSTGGASTLKMVKKSVERVNKRVAALLPLTTKDLESRDLSGDGTEYAALRNKTVSFLEINGQCIDDVKVNDSTTHRGLFAQRPIKKGDVIAPVPMYAMRHERSCSAAGGDECSNLVDERAFVKYCFGHVDSSLLLCPLTLTAFVRATSKETDSVHAANAVYEWASRSNTPFMKAPVDAILEQYTLSLSFDLVALKDIQPGDEILVDIERIGGEEGGPIQVNVGMFPDIWIEAVQ